jgi:hypothetical protein
VVIRRSRFSFEKEWGKPEVRVAAEEAYVRELVWRVRGFLANRRAGAKWRGVGYRYASGGAEFIQIAARWSPVTG